MFIRKIFMVNALKEQKCAELAIQALKASVWHILYSDVDVANIWWYFACSANEKRTNTKKIMPFASRILSINFCCTSNSLRVNTFAVKM